MPVTLNTYDPQLVCTTISREYAIAAGLGFSRDDLMTFARNAVTTTSFTTAARRTPLFGELQT